MAAVNVNTSLPKPYPPHPRELTLYGFLPPVTRVIHLSFWAEKITLQWLTAMSLPRTSSHTAFCKSIPLTRPASISMCNHSTFLANYLSKWANVARLSRFFYWYMLVCVFGWMFVCVCVWMCIWFPTSLLEFVHIIMREKPGIWHKFRFFAKKSKLLTLWLHFVCHDTHVFLNKYDHFCLKNAVQICVLLGWQWILAISLVDYAYNI